MRYAKIGFIVALVVIIAGCDKEIAVDEDKIEPIVVEAGKTFTISLESGPAEGYSWQAEFNTTFLELIDKELLPNSSAIGAESVERFKFLALKQGQVEVTMLYKREWDNETIKKQIVIVQILPATPKTLTVKQVGENMKQLDGQVVRIKGKFCGWDVGDDVMGTRITRSDWGVRDDTGTIWVTGGTGGLDPSYRSKDIGKSIILTASVLKQSGTSAYFLKAIDVRVES